MNPENFAHWCDGAFKIAATLGIAFGALWGLFEFYDAKQMIRTENSHEYIQRLHAGKVEEAEQFLVSYWSKRQRDNANNEKTRPAIIDTVEKTEDYELHLKNILNFLEQVSFCVNQDRCEKKIVIESFEGLFEAAFINHHAWIKEQRSVTINDRYFEKLECFVHINIKKIESTICREKVPEERKRNIFESLFQNIM